MSTRVEFRLSMPGVGSWNGRWSGEGHDYRIVRHVDAEQMERLRDAGMNWTYAWDDGWCAGVHARVMNKGERKRKSDGFCGYEWMVDNIVRWGTPHCRHNWVDDHRWNDGKDWIRCSYCGRSTTDTTLAEPTPC